jgi:prevent-host-death family protein
MERIGVRQLRERLAATLDRVQAGEVIEVTENEQPIARIVPLVHRSRIEQLTAEGRLLLPEEPGSILDLEPLPGLPGERSLSEALAELRADER